MKVGSAGFRRRSVALRLPPPASSNTHIRRQLCFTPLQSAISPGRTAAGWFAGALLACYASCDIWNEKGSLMTDLTDASPDRSALVYRFHERLYRLALLTFGNADTAAVLLQ